MKTTVLQEIAKSVASKMSERKKLISFSQLFEEVKKARKPHDFSNAFFSNQVQVISEVKFKSPALGQFKDSSSELAVDIAGSYLAGGATAISVLTEEEYFNGNLKFLISIRKKYPEALLLMKDFIIDEYQILEGLLAGADAILLILSLLGFDRTKKLMSFAKSYGLSVLVEVHDEEELNLALSLKAKLIGINNRNLKTLAVDLSTSFSLIQILDLTQYPSTIFISESGINTAAEMKALKLAGFSAFLMGSVFMTSGDPKNQLQKMIFEASS